MHSARSQRRLARMTGRVVPSTDVLLDRRSAHDAHIAGRGSPRVGYPAAKQGSNNGPSTCVLFHSSALHCPHVPHPSSSGDIPDVDASVFAADDGNSGGFNPANGQNSSLTPAIAPQTPNSLGLAIQADDVGYVATIQMGTPPRDFNLLMDSGSADLWVGAEACTSVDGGDCVSSSECFALSALILCEGKPRISWTAILLFVRGHTETFPSDVWLRSCGWRHYHGQHCRRRTAASQSHLWSCQS